MSLFLQAALKCEEGTEVKEDPAHDPDAGVDATERLRREALRQRLDTIRVRARREENVKKIEARRAAKDEERVAAAAEIENERIAENQKVKDAIQAEKDAEERAKAKAAAERAEALAARKRRQVLEDRYTAIVEEDYNTNKVLEDKVENFDADATPFADTFSFIDRIRIINKRAVKMSGEKQVPVSMMDVYGITPPKVGPQHRKFLRTDMSQEAMERVEARFKATQEAKVTRESARSETVHELVGMEDEDEGVERAAAAAKDAERVQGVLQTARRVLGEREMQRRAREAEVMQALIKSALHPVDIFQQAVSADIVEERFRETVDLAHRGTNNKKILDDFIESERDAVDCVDRSRRHVTEVMTSQRVQNHLQLPQVLPRPVPKQAPAHAPGRRNTGSSDGELPADTLWSRA